MKLVECVLISEGRNQEAIDAIVAAIASAEGAPRSMSIPDATPIAPW
jgi:glutamate formiminotransferase